jgi:hypothetical protein
LIVFRNRDDDPGAAYRSRKRERRRGPAGYEAATDFARREGEWAFSYLCPRTRCAEVLSSVLGDARDAAELLAIEFIQSMEEQGELRRGRFWYAPKYPYDRAAKPKDFTEWAAQLMTLAKRELTRVDDNWLGRRALERLESGRLRLQS